MKALAATAVFGLLPLPPMDDKAEQELGRSNPRATGDLDLALRDAEVPASLAERMATKRELARLREELRSIGKNLLRPCARAGPASELSQPTSRHSA
jgi:hypothetical protein